MSGVYLCPICDSKATDILLLGGRDASAWDCESCGRYEYSRSVERRLSSLQPHEKVRLKGWLSDQQPLTDLAAINTWNLGEILAAAPPSIPQRASRLLRKAAAITNAYGRPFLFDDRKLLGPSYSVDASEVQMLMDFLSDEGLIKDFQHRGQAVITAKGYVELEKRALTSPTITQAFIAMWFDEAMSCVFDEAMNPAIEQAGYQSLRIDKKDHLNKIDDEIIAEIRRSRFLVADFTGHRGGVYFETGFAMGLGLPVIFTCWEDDIQNLHFDIRQYNTIAWQSTEDLRSRLYQRIRAVIGEGPKARN